MSREQPSRDEKIAARLARMMGIQLSSEEYARGDDLGIDATSGLMPAQQPPEEPFDEAKFDAGQLLAKLLRAGGCYLPTSIEGAEGRAHLIQTAMRKIQDLRDSGGGKGGATNLNPNPLVAQVQQGGINNNQGGPEPMYMSLEVSPERAEAVRALLKGMNINVH